MFSKITALLALSLAPVCAQITQPAPIAPASVDSSAATPEITLEPDMDDAGVRRAEQDLERVKQLIGQGALPLVRLRKAVADLDDAKDMSILRKSLFSQDITAEQADQMVLIAQRMYARKQRALIETKQLVDSGIISRAEGEASAADLARTQNELDLAQSRALLTAQMAESLRLQKAIASLETESETHPDWNGKVYTRYDGSGLFTPADFQKISLAFSARFARQIPVSADGETATHRALGFDHRGRIDVALNPDQPEGVWLLRYLEKSHIPYFAFRAAVPHKATGAHIHIGPQSTRLSIAEHHTAGL